MSVRLRWRAGAAIGAALAALVAPVPAGAHNAGRVELLVTNLKFSHEGQGTGTGVKVSADLIDRDTGQSAGGFAMVVSAVGPNGDRAGPVALTEPRGSGRYEGVLALLPGSWTVTARAEQGTSALPALSSTRRVRVTLDDSGVVAKGLGGGGSDLGMWVALVVAGIVLGFVLTRGMGRPATAPAGQRTRTG